MKGGFTLPSYTKRGKSWQYVISRVVDGKSKPIRKGGFATKKEAMEAAIKVEAALKEGSLVLKNDYPLAKYFYDWFKTYKQDISPITVNTYRATHKKIVGYFADTPIQSITKRQYQQFLNHLALTYAKTTNRKVNSLIRACVKEAVDEQLIKVDFTRSVTISGSSSKKSSEKYLNYKDSQRLLQYLIEHQTKQPEYPLLIVAATTGMRYGELVGLTYDDINRSTNRIKIHCQWKYKSKDGGFGPLKNASSERTISVDEQTMTILLQQIERSKSQSNNVHQLIFYASDSPIQVITNDRLNDVLRTVQKKLKISPLITVHGLRHTHASILIYEGVSVLSVSERLGHASTDITTSTYLHLIKELREQDSTKITSIFNTIFQNGILNDPV